MTGPVSTDRDRDDVVAAIDDAQPSSRTAFIAIVWVAIGLGLVGQLTDGASSVRNALAVATVVALAGWLHAVHRIHRTATLPERRTVVLLIGVYLALVALLAIDPAHFIALFAAYTLTFVLLDDLRLSIAMSFIVTVIWMCGWVYHDLPTGALPTPALVWATLVAIVIALDRVSAISEQRRQLLDELHRTRSQLAESEHERGMLHERERLAAEIHDTLAQGFTSIVLLSEANLAAPDTNDTRHLTLIAETARENLQSTRRLVDGLRPVELDTASLTDAISAVAERHRARWPERVDVTIDPCTHERPIDDTAEIALLRVLQEAMNNAAKHAGAELIDIDVTCTPDTLELTISDDGGGFDIGDQPTAVAGGVGGRGLELMAARLAAVGGRLDVTSRPGAGTTIGATVPVSESERTS